MVLFRNFVVDPNRPPELTEEERYPNGENHVMYTLKSSGYRRGHKRDPRKQDPLKTTGPPEESNTFRYCLPSEDPLLTTQDLEEKTSRFRSFLHNDQF